MLLGLSWRLALHFFHFDFKTPIRFSSPPMRIHSFSFFFFQPFTISRGINSNYRSKLDTGLGGWGGGGGSIYSIWNERRERSEVHREKQKGEERC